MAENMIVYVLLDSTPPESPLLNATLIEKILANKNKDLHLFSTNVNSSSHFGFELIYSFSGA